jgi:nitrate/TMAO reductase-like tetraheme cytochrome c subunit
LNFRLTTRLLALVAVLLTVIVVGTGVALVATSQPQFCATCKSHKPYVAAYEKSRHNHVNCEQCHSIPGPFFFLTAKLQALQQPIHQLTGSYEKPILGTVLNQSCRRCHTNKTLFKVISVNGIRVQHQHLIEAGFLCNRCHSTVAHGMAVPPGSRTYPSMDQCLLCHNNQYKDAQGQVATSRCDLCHVKPPPGALPATHRDPKWARDHGAIGILSTCTACHKPKPDCVKCHRGVLMPHNEPSWTSQHGAVSRQLGRQACALCHDVKRYCVTCHKVPMPHAPNYISTHPKWVANYGTATCFNCHVVSNCQTCHVGHALGKPPAHDLFKGIPYRLPPTPSFSPSALGY